MQASSSVHIPPSPGLRCIPQPSNIVSPCTIEVCRAGFGSSCLKAMSANGRPLHTCTWRSSSDKCRSE
jgi:hypothetical protein